VITVDTNILVYAHRRDSEWQAAAAACIERLAEGSVPWGKPWSCVHEFLAIATCTSHRVSELLTADREFGRFPTLRTRNPLVPQR
jgi:predicted nucleic acid-binding protein